MQLEKEKEIRQRIKERFALIDYSQKTILNKIFDRLYNKIVVDRVLVLSENTLEDRELITEDNKIKKKHSIITIKTTTSKVSSMK